MKVFISTLLTCLLICNLHAQKGHTWFDMALTGSGGGCLMTSKNMFKDTKTVNSSPSFCYSFGGKFGINFNESHELAATVEYFNRNQSYNVNLDSLGKFKKSIVLKGLDLALLYRFRGKESSGYVEIGPQLSLVQGAEETREGKTMDVAGQLQPSYISGVFGFGSNIVVANAFTWTGGFRFTYCLGDMISQDGGKGSNISYPLNDTGASKHFDAYTPFRTTTLVLHTEFTFDLGYFAKSKCKRGRVSFLRFK
jgi:hypothetical protein